jgi:hypothetical protein
MRRPTALPLRIFVMWHTHICDFHCGPVMLVYF